MTDDLNALAGLTHHMKRVLGARLPDGWFSALAVTDQLIASAGATLSAMTGRGLLERDVSRTTLYRLTPLGLAVRARLAAQQEGQR